MRLLWYIPAFCEGGRNRLYPTLTIRSFFPLPRGLRSGGGWEKGHATQRRERATMHQRPISDKRARHRDKEPPDVDKSTEKRPGD